MGYYSYRGDPPRRLTIGTSVGENLDLFWGALLGTPVNNNPFPKESRSSVWVLRLVATSIVPKTQYATDCPNEKLCCTACVWCVRAFTVHRAPRRTFSAELRFLQLETWLNGKRYLIVAAFRGNFNRKKRSTWKTRPQNALFSAFLVCEIHCVTQTKKNNTRSSTTRYWVVLALFQSVFATQNAN